MTRIKEEEKVYQKSLASCGNLVDMTVHRSAGVASLGDCTISKSIQKEYKAGWGSFHKK